jgi:hypothetical protein
MAEGEGWLCDGTSPSIDVAVLVDDGSDDILNAVDIGHGGNVELDKREFGGSEGVAFEFITSDSVGAFVASVLKLYDDVDTTIFSAYHEVDAFLQDLVKGGLPFRTKSGDFQESGQLDLCQHKVLRKCLDQAEKQDLLWIAHEWFCCVRQGFPCFCSVREPESLYEEKDADNAKKCHKHRYEFVHSLVSPLKFEGALFPINNFRRGLS